MRSAITYLRSRFILAYFRLEMYERALEYGLIASYVLLI